MITHTPRGQGHIVSTPNDKNGMRIGASNEISQPVEEMPVVEVIKRAELKEMSAKHSKYELMTQTVAILK